MMYHNTFTSIFQSSEHHELKILCISTVYTCGIFAMTQLQVVVWNYVWIFNSIPSICVTTLSQYPTIFITICCNIS